jgi:hypothetical protein
MFDIRKFTRALVAVAALGFASLPATAATVVVLDDSTQGGGNTADLYGAGYGANTPLGSSWSFDPTWPAGNVGGQAQSPFNNTPALGPQDYFAVGNNTVPSPVTLTFGVAQSAFSILWGSIDDYNEIVFNLTGGGTFSYNGDALATLLGIAPPLVTNYEHVALVSFSNFTSGTFDSVSFYSHGAAAFEFGLAPVPLPAGGLLLIGALGGLAALRRRKTA